MCYLFKAMFKRIGCFILLLFLFFSCDKSPDALENALQLAGSNRSELEKVLHHYAQSPSDSLKYRAAVFLIENMPSHYTFRDSRMEAFRDYLNKNEVNESAWENFNKTYRQFARRVEIEPDIEHVKSDFLIRNIDFSFNVWQETPWGKQASFDAFCEEILPYRLSHEPLEEWKDAYYTAFRPFIDKMEHNNCPENICKNLIQDEETRDWFWNMNFFSEGFGALTLLQKKYGNCKEQTEFIAYILRSLGIPSGIDILIQHPQHLIDRHYWNYTHSVDGHLFAFELDGDYAINGRWKARRFGKAYRQCFAVQKEALSEQYKGIYIPEGGLRDNLLRDVSDAYSPDTHITVCIDSSIRLSRKDLAYLCVFNTKAWNPIAWCKPKSGKVIFRNVEPDILFQVRLINDTHNIALTMPFIFHGNENIQFLDVDTNHLISLTLFRKFSLPLLWSARMKNAVGGKFQGANRSDFSDSVTLHTITKPADYSWVDVQPDHSGKLKYVRYLSAPFHAHNNMAEAKFYSEGNLLDGEVIGTDGSQGIFPNDTKHALFDDDPLSFFDAVEPHGAWSGLAFDKAYHIDAIRYLYRNDDNGIRKGDRYELFYQRGGEWLSAGIQTADTTFLIYQKVPTNALYWLHNHTRGREERPFIYEDGKQLFY